MAKLVDLNKINDAMEGRLDYVEFMVILRNQMMGEPERFPCRISMALGGEKDMLEIVPMFPIKKD